MDTENYSYCGAGEPISCSRYKILYKQARDTLSLLAEESGGQMYKARELKDLDGVYKEVLNDLGTVYSFGYVPSNDKRDASWRAVEVEIPAHFNLIARTRTGYYAK